MPKVKIYGAGSIGNHLANASRTQGFEVLITDIDQEALDRTKNDIYPSRYGAFDESIRLVQANDIDQSEFFDVVIVGTPPDTHLSIALNELKDNPPKVMLIEKPLCGPDLAGCQELFDLAEKTGTFVGVGYNHTLTKNTVEAGKWLSSAAIGDVQTLVSMTREYWGGIFNAHPWLSGPSDTYLGFSSRGGGALGEHSHAINIWQHFSALLGKGRITSVSAMLDWVEKDGARYDRIAQLNVKTEKGLVGTIVQDVVTEPSKKWLRVQGEAGFLEWEVGAGPDYDAVRTWKGDGAVEENQIKKTRPDDFLPEMAHVSEILKGNVKDSPISLTRGLETMLVIAAAMESSSKGKEIHIDYSKGWSLDALTSEKSSQAS